MRKIVVTVLVTLALAVMLPASASQRSAGAADRAAPHPRHASRQANASPLAATDAFVFNEGFFTQTLNHFGSASKGSVIAETWAEDGFNASNQEVNTQGVVRAILLPKALRVSAKVQLFGVDASDNEHLLASSSTVNSNGALTVRVATPEITLATQPNCFFFTAVHMGIRWSDSRLSTVDFSMPVLFVNGGNPACATAT